MRLALTLLVFAPALVFAQGDDDAVRQLFQEGLDHAENERWVAAEEVFSRALAMRWRGQIAYNLAYSRSELGRFVDAVELCDEILRRGEVSDEVKGVTRTLRDEAQPRIGSVTVEIEGDAEDVELTLNGRSIPIAEPVHVDPGIYNVVARRDGLVVGRAEQTVREGAAATVRLSDLAPRVEREPEVRVVVVPGERESSRVGLIVGIIVGVVLAGAAVGLGVGLTRDGQLPSGSLGTVDGR